MKNIFVKKWLDYDTKEADVTVCTCEAEFSVYAPRYDKSANFPVTLYAMFAEDIFLSCDEPSITRSGYGSWAYKIVGKVTCTEPPTAKLCDGVYIELDENIPKDIKTGENIEFYTGRLDLY